MFDIRNALATPTLADVSFRIGNSNRPETWLPAPVPASLTVRPGDGVGGSDRVTISWPDGAIVGRWLEITVHSNAVTALVNDDVFYFGNAIGESGNDPDNALVNATDVLAARDNPQGPFNLADITHPYDYNRDRVVTATDVIMARDHVTSPLTTLRLITPPTAAVAFDDIASALAARSAEIPGEDMVGLDAEPQGQRRLQGAVRRPARARVEIAALRQRRRIVARPTHDRVLEEANIDWRLPPIWEECGLDQTALQTLALVGSPPSVPSLICQCILVLSDSS